MNRTLLRRLLLCVVLWGFACAAVLAAAEKAAKKPAEKPADKSGIEAEVKRYEAKDRDVVKKQDEVVAACGLKPGMIVADVGAGSGLFTRRFAAAVGTCGKVFAVDVDKQCVEHIAQTCRQQKIANVVGVVGKADSTELPAESVDLVFVCDSYHHFDRPAKMLSSIHRALRPGGRLLLIDFTKEGPMKDHVRADKQTLLNDLAAAGFKLVDALDFLPDQYVLRLEKPR